jgi:hypothetical protein
MGDIFHRSIHILTELCEKAEKNGEAGVCADILCSRPIASEWHPFPCCKEEVACKKPKGGNCCKPKEET